MITKQQLENSKIEVVLASASPYKKMILEKIIPEFISFSPNVDEDQYKDEKINVIELGEKLAYLKAKDFKANKNQIIIGADQICYCEGIIFNKPNNFENAFKQLQFLSGKTHQLHTSVSIIYNDVADTFTDTTNLLMKSLTDEQITQYLNTDTPFNSAGSYKIEEHGIYLFENINMNDYFSIIGLPLIEINHRIQKIIHQVEI